MKTHPLTAVCKPNIKALLLSQHIKGSTAFLLSNCYKLALKWLATGAYLPFLKSTKQFHQTISGLTSTYSGPPTPAHSMNDNEPFNAARNVDTATIWLNYRKQIKTHSKMVDKRYKYKVRTLRFSQNIRKTVARIKLRVWVESNISDNPELYLIRRLWDLTLPPVSQKFSL